MKLRACLFLLTLAGLVQAIPATAQTIHRCGNEYSLLSCPGGTTVANDDRRSPDEVAEGLRLFSESKRQAAEMEQDRIQRQTAEPPKLAASLGPSHPAAIERKPKIRSSKRHRSSAADRSARSGDFIAGVPAVATAKKNHGAAEPGL